jgi:hypothetical protein
MAELLGGPVEREEVEDALARAFLHVFGAGAEVGT